MKSALRTVIERLRSDALSASQRIFDVGRVRQSALEVHPDTASVLSALVVLRKLKQLDLIATLKAPE